LSARDPLVGVWDRADAAEARFAADEVSSWPEGHEALLTEAGIIHRDNNTTTVTCDACREGHVEDVALIRSPPGSPVRAYIHCPEAGRVAVPLDRLKQWVVDFDGLAGAVARGLHLAGEVEELVRARLWFLGRMTVAGKSRDVFLARGATWIDAPDIFGPRARLSASRGAILLVPGGTPTTDAWADDPPCAIALKLVARFEDRRLAFDRDHVESVLAVAVAVAEPAHRLNREQIEEPIYSKIDEIKREAATMDEDDPRRPRTTQPEVARRLDMSRSTLQQRLKILDELRVSEGLPKLRWEDFLRGQRS
jgi:hypothetical protein